MVGVGDAYRGDLGTSIEKYGGLWGRLFRNMVGFGDPIEKHGGNWEPLFRNTVDSGTPIENYGGIRGAQSTIS